jgi:hypothetical protein
MDHSHNLWFKTVVIAVMLVCFAFDPGLASDSLQLSDTGKRASHPALQPFDLDGKELPEGAFLVRARGKLPDIRGIKVHGKYKDVYLVSGKPEIIKGFTRQGWAVLAVDDLPDMPAPGTRKWTRIDSPDPDIEAMVAQVQWVGILDKIRTLVGFGTRYSYATNHEDVVQMLRDAFDSYGLQTELYPYISYGPRNMHGKTMWNVEATQVGTLYPNSYLIICGHFDSISMRKPFDAAPGADDNATGTAAVLTAAEILSQYEFEYSIRYVCFSGEEIGLIGSKHYTTMARRQNVKIVGALNFDMMGYWEPGVEKDLEIETNRASLWLARAITNAADLYTNAPYELHVYDGAWWGDHFMFWKSGYAAVNHEESWDWNDPDFNPHYHSTYDLIKYLHPGFTTGNIQIGVASLATLAKVMRPMAVSFDYKPGSCDNPFNPKSKGVVSCLLAGSADFNVHDINISSIRLNDFVSPVKLKIEDRCTGPYIEANPCDDPAPDGFDDLALKFSTADITALVGPVGKGDEILLVLRGSLSDGTVFEGEDVVLAVGNTGALTAQLASPEPSGDDGSAGRNSVKPNAFALHQNVPNPFNPTTTIRFDVPAAGGRVTLQVYDVSGRLVRTLVNGPVAGGQKSVTWDGLNEAGNPLATGLYLYRLKGPGFEQTRKMVLLK